MINFKDNIILIGKNLTDFQKSAPSYFREDIKKRLRIRNPFTNYNRKHNSKMNVT